MKDSFGDIFFRIISQQTQNRDQVKWKKELRIININIKSKSKLEDPGLKELILTHNKFGPQFLKNMLIALKDDNYLRVLDVRKNKFTEAVMQDTTHYDVVKMFKQNESLTNIDFRENEGYNKILKYKLSLIMMRNIDLIRAKGVFVQGSWLNKKILMFKETMQSQMANNSKDGSPFKELEKMNHSDDESIFNVQFSENALENM